MGYENRLIEEMHDHQVLSDDDFVVGEDGEPDLTTLNDDVDIDDLKEEFNLFAQEATNAGFDYKTISETLDLNAFTIFL